MKNQGRKINIKLALLFCLSIMSIIFINISGTKAEEVSLSTVTLKSEYVVSEMLTVPKAQINYTNETKDASHYVIFPTGVKYSDGEFRLNTAGNYSIIYYADFNGEQKIVEKNFVVKYNAEKLFTANNAATITHKTDYVNDTAFTGLSVEATTGGKVQTNYTVNLSQKKRSDVLLDLVVIPKTAGTEDFSKITIEIADINNIDNKITIVYTDSTKINADGAATYVKAAAPGQILTGAAGASIRSGTIYHYGTCARHSFRGDRYGLATDDVSLKLYYDYENKAIYVSNDLNAYQGYEGKVCDFDDYTYFARLWGGFSTGEVSISISAENITGESANFMILGFDGMSFNEKYIADEILPVINIDTITPVPTGVVNVPYPLFSYGVWDNLSGLVKEKVQVFYSIGNNLSSECNINDNSFIPKYAGEYIVLYTATDAFGNTASRRVLLSVIEQAQDINIDLSGAVLSAELGSKVPIAEYALSGGSAPLELSTIVTYNGQNTELSDGYFIPYNEGVYTVKYTVTDFLGTRETAQYNIEVVLSQKPVLQDEIILPQIFINGFSYNLPIITALDYYGNVSNPKVITPIIKVNGVELVNGIFTPSVQNNTTANVVYTYIGETGGAAATRELSYNNVPIVVTKSNSNIYKQNYFYSNTVTSEMGSAYVLLKTSVNNAETLFVNKLQVENFSIKIGILNQKFNFGKLTFTLTDSENPSICAVITLYKENSDLRMTINDSQPITVQTTLNSTGDGIELLLRYKNGDYSVADNSGVVRTYINRNIDGKHFLGFVSGSVYITLGFDDVVAQSEISVISINSQIFNNAYTDRAEPIIVVNNLPSGQMEINSTIVIPSAKTYDVLSDIKYTTVSLLTPDGTYAVAKDGTVLNKAPANIDYSVVMSQYGNYIINYYAEDMSNQQSSLGRYISVVDKEPPVITLKSSLKSSYKVNSTINLPDYTVTDNLDSSSVKVYINIIDPNGGLLTVSDLNFKPTIKGRYKISYFAVDEYYNYCVEVVYINVN